MIINNERRNNYLSKTELFEMANVMSDAFLNHSNFVYTIVDDKRRKKALYGIFLMMFRIINIYGFTYLVWENNHIVGYITFMDSSDKEQISFRRILKTRGFLLVLNFLISLKFSEIRKLIAYIKTYNNYELTEVKEHKIHLYSTGVKSEYKGKGLMGNAIRKTYKYFKDLGYLEMVLETADPINIPIYKKLGFDTIENKSTKDNQQTICFMSKTL